MYKESVKMALRSKQNRQKIQNKEKQIKKYKLVSCKK